MNLPRSEDLTPEEYVKTVYQLLEAAQDYGEVTDAAKRTCKDILKSFAPNVDHRRYPKVRVNEGGLKLTWSTKASSRQVILTIPAVPKDSIRLDRKAFKFGDYSEFPTVKMLCVWLEWFAVGWENRSHMERLDKHGLKPAVKITVDKDLSTNQTDCVILSSGAS